jgi:hypothetical protein
VLIVDPAVARSDLTSYALLRKLAHQLHPGVVKQ